jgi:general secretion pathway protein E
MNETKTLNTEDSQRQLAEKFGIPVLEVIPPPPSSIEFIRAIPYAFVKRHFILPIREEQQTLVIATADPLNLEALEELRLIVRRPLQAVYASRHHIMQAMHDYYREINESASELIASMNESDGSEAKEVENDVYDLLDQQTHAPIVQLLNMILTEAIQQGASDIHFEPFEEDLRVRYRIDGVLQTRHSPPLEYQAQLLTRIKVMAHLDIAEHRLPQDGRIKLRLGGREVDFRVSTIPVSHGERIVLRILDKGNITLGLDKMGMPDNLSETLRKLIALPEGILLVTGPTGSGKTTTLYSAISEISNDEINIMTIEDPVEYKLPGIAQIGVKPKIGMTFAAGLRHILRQDPDVIMVGEIRDQETAEIAIQSSLTGHLVLSTLHTNDAPSALTRLVDMGIEPYLLSSSVVGILAQRLIRTICPHCKTGYPPMQRELDDLSLAVSSLHEGLLYQGKGCAECYGSGYKGRRGIFELMVIGNTIRKQIVQSADAMELRHLAVQTGMSTLAQQGAQLAREGSTTVAEILRVTRGMEV